MGNSRLSFCFFCVVFFVGYAFAKAQQEQPPINMEYQRALSQAQEETADGDFNQAEANYKKAIALDPSNADASYNLGNLHYENNKRFEAVDNYKKAAETATSKEARHLIYHNLGNTFLENKQYKEAVEAYKNALRNDPTDDETRYNLAIAKQEEEKQGGGGGGNDDQEKDKPNEDDGEQEDNKDGDQDDKSDGDKKGGENEKEGEDKPKNGEEKEDDKGKNSEGDKGKDKPKDQQQQQPQRVEGKLTPQQVRQLLEAMSNEEQKIQEKVNGNKTKGKTVKSEKDW